MLPYFDYLDIIWNKTNKTNLYELDILYKKIAKIALDYNKLESSMKVYKDMKWLPLQENKKSSGKQEKFLFHTVTQKIYQRI